MHLITNTLIVGAGPFGLGLAAYLQQHSHDYRIVGKPMDFWKRHMPKGMLLRSKADWYLDSGSQWTIDRFLTLRYPSHQSTDPISRDQYIAYVDWFSQQAGIVVLPNCISRLSQQDHSFKAEMDNGDTIQVRNVVLAIGFQYFTHLPARLTNLLPVGRFQHTCEAVDMDSFRGKRVLLIGGRQSAFESAALLREAGAQHIHLSYRHDTPRFEEADWSWVEPLMEHMVEQLTWFGELSDQQQEQYRHKLWAEGRLKLEPWLEERIHQAEISLHPRTEIVSVSLQPNQSLGIGLNSGMELAIDEVLLATGYQVNIARIPFLSESIQEGLITQNGFPVLDAQFQSSIPGLYFSSFAAGHSFGPFFGFTVGVRAAAQLIGRALLSSADAAPQNT